MYTPIIDEYITSAEAVILSVEESVITTELDTHPTISVYMLDIETNPPVVVVSILNLIS